MRTVLVQPEYCRHAGQACAVDGQLDPVTDRFILDLAHAPDVALLDVLFQQYIAVEVSDAGHAVFSNFEGLVV